MKFKYLIILFIFKIYSSEFHNEENPEVLLGLAEEALKKHVLNYELIFDPKKINNLITSKDKFKKLEAFSQKLRKCGGKYEIYAYYYLGIINYNIKNFIEAQTYLSACLDERELPKPRRECATDLLNLLIFVINKDNFDM